MTLYRTSVCYQWGSISPNNRKIQYGLLKMVLEVLWRTETPMKLVFLATQLPSTASLREFPWQASLKTILRCPSNVGSTEASDEEVHNFVVQRVTHCASDLTSKAKVLKLQFAVDEKFAWWTLSKTSVNFANWYVKLTNKLNKDEARPEDHCRIQCTCTVPAPYRNGHQ